MKTIYTHLLTVSVLFILTFSACRVPKQAALPSQKAIPETFVGNADDTSSMAYISVGTFFPDPKLQALIAEVLQHNPDMQIALQRISVSAAYLSAGRAALFPSLNFQAAASGTRYGKYTMEGVGNFDTNLSPNINDDQRIGVSPTPDFWLGLVASWEIDIWGKLRNMKKSARYRFLASQQGRHLITSQLIAHTAALYYELVTLDAEALIILENISLQEKALEVVEAQKGGGRATELAVQQFKAQLLNTRSAEFSIRQQITEAENNLNALAGRFTGTIERSSAFMPGSYSELLKVGIPAQLLENRPDLKQAEFELEATRADVKAARAAFFPSITLSAYGAFNAFKSGLLFDPTSLAYQLLGGLTAPIFQRNQLKVQFNVATASQQEAFYQYQKTALNAYREVMNLMSGIDNMQQMFELKKQEVEALGQGVSVANELYVTGYASYLEIVSAQKSKLEAQLELVNLERRMMISLIDLYRATGGGWR